MKAITIHQPWAHLIAVGEKRVENRTWKTNHRGPLAIHAGKSRASLRDGDEDRYPDMPFGAIVAVVTLVDCVELNAVRDGLDAGRYPWLATHPYAEGPWLWILEDARPLVRPMPWAGKLGLCDVYDSVICAGFEVPGE